MNTQLVNSTRRLLYPAAGLLLLCLGLFAFLRGSVQYVTDYASIFYVLNYSEGLIRRGLVGEIFSWFIDQRNLTAIRAAAVPVYTALQVALLGCLFAWVAVLELRRRDFMLVVLFAVFLTSQFIPTVAHLVGFLDVYDFLLLTIAAVGFVRKQYAIAVVAGAVAPFIHEAFIFCWLALGVLVLREQVSRLRVAVLFVPLFSTVVVYFGPSSRASIELITASVLSEEWKTIASVFVLGQTFTGSLGVMLAKFHLYPFSFFIAAPFYLFPAAVLIVAYGLSRRSRADTIALVCATAAPLAILFLGWDLSRFLVGANFYAMLGILYMETVQPAGCPSRAALLACCLAVIVLGSVPNHGSVILYPLE